MKTNLEFHEAADEFPLLRGERLNELVDDIREHGLREPIMLCEGKILDGRNRYIACNKAGIEPRFTDVFDGNPFDYAWSLNGERRDLTSDQRYLIWKSINEHSAVWLERQTEIQAEANENRSKAAKAGKVGRAAAKQEFSASTSSGHNKAPRGKGSAEKAKASKTNRGTVERMDRLEREAPSLAKKVKVGEIAGAAAVREMKESKRELRRTQNKKKVAQIDKPDSLLGNVKFATIVIDPPWDWGDEGDVNQLGRAKPDYHTLSLKEIHELPVSRLSDTDCHLYMWITNRSLPKGFALLEAWGFRYVTCITWVKPSIGMGNYFRGQTEHVLFGVKGSQQLKRKDQGTVFMAPRGKGGHSSKPKEFYDIVESCSPGPYLDMFSRAELEGWSHWGESSNE